MTVHRLIILPPSPIADDPTPTHITNSNSNDCEEGEICIL